MTFDKKALNTIALDFNGVLDTYEGYREGFDYPLRPGTEEFLKSLKDKGYRIVIVTAARLATVDKILEKAGLSLYIDEITNIKVPAIIYVDDRAITFNGSFEDALNAIETFKPHWKTQENGEPHD